MKILVVEDNDLNLEVVTRKLQRAGYEVVSAGNGQEGIDVATKELPDLLANKYDLVANITHQNPADVGREEKVDPLQEGSYKCHVQHRATGQWYEIQDLHVQEIMPQQIGISESNVLIFRRSGLK